MEKRKCPKLGELIFLVTYSKLPRELEEMLREEPTTHNAVDIRAYKNRQEAHTLVNSWGTSGEDVKVNLIEHLLDCPECFRDYVNLTVDKAVDAIKRHPEVKARFYEVVKCFDFLNLLNKPAN